ncbi:MAG TPA: Fic family protein [Candidatus Izemoplasmatales bacterium]|nr:Fic family protein [Candidatus Izemoplasmatales bacterium]
MEYSSLYNLYFQDKAKQETIYQERFGSESSYHFDLKISGNQAFLFLHPDHFALITEIYRLDKKIQILSDALPGAAAMQFIKECLINEIKNTNDIEGVVSTKKEIRDILDQLSNRKNDRLFGMVNRYKFLLENHDFNLKTPSDVRRIYDELVGEEIRQSNPDEELDGTVFRKNTVYLYRAAGKVLHEGINPESEIIAYLSSALRILEVESLDLLIRLSVFHYLFGYIHPFYNGNGRVNRFIGSYLLNRTFTPVVSFRMSQQIKEQKKLYYEAFEKTNDARNRGDLGTFCFYFLQILKNLFASTLTLLTEKTERLNHYHGLLDSCRLQDKEKRLLFLLIQGSLFSDHGITIRDLAKNMDQSVPWVRKKITLFHSRNWIQKTRNGREFGFSADLSAMEPLPSLQN